MIKDLVVNLSVAPARDAAAEFAISVARAFDAHVTGVAFQYDALIPLVTMDGLPPDVIESQILESERAAKAAVAKFDDMTRACVGLGRGTPHRSGSRRRFEPLCRYRTPV